MMGSGMEGHSKAICSKREPQSYCIFLNDVIFRILTSYLDWQDLRNLREVSSPLNEMVLRNSKFISRARLVLDGKVYDDSRLSSISFDPKYLTIYPVKTEHLSPTARRTTADAITKLVSQIARTCISLTIINRPGHCYNWKEIGHSFQLHCPSPAPPGGDSLFSPFGDSIPRSHFDNIPIPDHTPHILTVLVSVTNLQELTFSHDAQVLLNEATLEHTKILESLIAVHFQDTRKLYIPPIFLRLTGLQLFTIRNESSSWSMRNSFDEDFDRLVHVLRCNQSTLTELRAWELNLWLRHEDSGSRIHQESVSTLFPHLHSVQLHSCPDPIAETSFLLTHFPQLKNLALRTRNVETLRALYRPVPHLEKLVLAAPEVDHDEAIRFLEHIKQMRLSKLSLGPVVSLNADDLILHPPVNLNVISYLPYSLTSLCLFHRIFSEHEILFYDPVQLANLPLLTNLTLGYLKGVSNAFIRGIFNHLLKLRYLKINNVEHMTTEALLEVRENSFHENVLTPLSNLKELQSLTLYCGRQVTTSAFTKGIKCQNLTHLKIDGVLDESDLVELLANNPKLSSLHCSFQDREPNIHDLKLQYPHLQSIQRN